MEDYSWNRNNICKLDMYVISLMEDIVEKSLTFYRWWGLLRGGPEKTTFMAVLKMVPSPETIDRRKNIPDTYVCKIICDYGSELAVVRISSYTICNTNKSEGDRHWTTSYSSSAKFSHTTPENGKSITIEGRRIAGICSMGQSIHWFEALSDEIMTNHILYLTWCSVIRSSIMKPEKEMLRKIENREKYRLNREVWAENDHLQSSDNFWAALDRGRPGR